MTTPLVGSRWLDRERMKFADFDTERRDFTDIALRSIRSSLSFRPPNVHSNLRLRISPHRKGNLHIVTECDELSRMFLGCKEGIGCRVRVRVIMSSWGLAQVAAFRRMRHA